MTDHISAREDGTVTDELEVLRDDAEPVTDEPEVLPDDAEPVTDFTDDDTSDPEDDEDLDDLTPEEVAALELMREQAKADNPAALDPEEAN
jgi:hypothetical protein